jgi:hypothetical protein
MFGIISAGKMKVVAGSSSCVSVRSERHMFSFLSSKCMLFEIPAVEFPVYV